MKSPATIAPRLCLRLLVGGVAFALSCAPAEPSTGSGDPDTGLPQTPPNEVPPPDPSVGYPPTHPTEVPPPDGPDDPDPPTTSPAVLAITPAEGSAAGGEVVTIQGESFQPGATVFFDDVEGVDVFYIDENWINVTTPLSKAGLADVTVLNPDGAEGTLEDGFRFASAIEVHTVEPALGDPAGGTPITVTGAGFSDHVLVLVGDRLATGVEIVDGATLTATTPPGAMGLADVRVILEGEDVGVLDDAFRFAAAPAPQGVWPPHGPSVGGAEVEIVARYLTPDTTVRIGGKPAEVVSVDPGNDTVTAMTPGGAVGVVSVELESSYGAGTLTGAYAYLAPAGEGLDIVSVTPPRGSAEGGYQLRLVVQGLDPQQPVAVEIGGTGAEVLAVGDYPDTVLVEVPPGQEGKRDVEVGQSGDWTALAHGFEYLPTLAIDAVAPGFVYQEGGDVLVVEGAGFGAGDATVWLGPVASPAVEVQHDGQLLFEAPECSPGRHDLTVLVGDRETTLSGAIECRTHEVRIFAVDPAEVAQSGGALVKVIGAGFPTSTSLRFGSDFGTDLLWTSPLTVWARVPQADVGPADLVVDAPGIDGTRFLQGAVTYYDPASSKAAVWGDRVDLTVNVSIYNGTNGKPLVGAMGIVGADPDSGLHCITDQRGQCSISQFGLQGPVNVTAAKDGYSAYTIAGTDGRNATMFIRPQAPPGQTGPPGSGGGGGPPPVNINSLLGTISGKVSGIGKYIVPPPPSCGIIGSPDGQQCTSCTEATGCPADLVCTPLTDTGSWCLKGCQSDAECAEGYACANVGFGAQCIPHGGDVSVRCETTRRDFFGSNPNPGPGANVDPAVGTYEIASRLGEVTVYCMGGYTNPANGQFIPTIMGIKPTVIVHLDEHTPNADIELNIPLTRTLRMRVFDLPRHEGGITSPNHRHGLDLGAEGWIPFPAQPAYTDGEMRFFAGFPETLTPFGKDAAYTFYIFTQAMVSGSVPSSYQLFHKLQSVDGDPVLTRDAESAWADANSGMRGDLFDVWGAAANDVFAVGPAGRIVHKGKLGWGAQPAFTDADLHAIWGAGEDEIWAVGQHGTILFFDGVTWNHETTAVPIIWDLRDVHSGWAVGDGGILRRDGSGIWKVQPALHSTLLRGIHAVSDDLVVAVGDSGKVLTWDGVSWISDLVEPSGARLNAVWSDGTTIVAVGNSGAVLWRTVDGEWNHEVVGVRDLLNVTGDGEGHVWATGEVGTILRLDLATGEWTDETDPGATRIDLFGAWEHGGEVLSVGRTSLPVGPWMEFPDPVNPRWNLLMDHSHLSWTYRDPDPVPSYTSISLSTGDGYTAWAVVAAGEVSSFDLPPLLEMIGHDPLRDGAKYFNMTRAIFPEFDIDGYRFNHLSLWNRTAWSTAFGIFY